MDTTSFTDRLIKENGWYRDIKKDGDVDYYGFSPRGLGDLLFNNLVKIIKDNDKSMWAQKVFDKSVVLLIQGKRWPDKMNPPKTKGKKNYRSQYSMTRDPWVMFYAACIHFEKREFISLKPQWWLYRPELWSLRKALLGKKNSYKFWSSLPRIKAVPGFVQTLDKYSDWSYDRK